MNECMNECNKYVCKPDLIRFHVVAQDCLTLCVCVCVCAWYFWIFVCLHINVRVSFVFLYIQLHIHNRNHARKNSCTMAHFALHTRISSVLSRSTYWILVQKSILVKE
jgi:hypothetical protein